MAHFAKLDENNIVIEVNLVANDALDQDNEEESGVEFLTHWSGGYANWKQTSYNGSIRKQFAGIGYTYDAINDVFISPQPYPSWSLDDNFDWQAPTPQPEEGKWYWDEDSLSWVEVESL
jgi:hypothetical protein